MGDVALAEVRGQFPEISSLLLMWDLGTELRLSGLQGKFFKLLFYVINLLVNERGIVIMALSQVRKCSRDCHGIAIKATNMVK